MCGLSRGSDKASVSGVVTFDASSQANGLRMSGSGGSDDAEPNNHLMQVQDLGELAGERQLGGTVGGAGDHADFFRFGVRTAGHVKIHGPADTSLLTFLV